MSNVLSEENRQQVIGLGRLGWTVRRIEKATGVRRETAGSYLRAAGIAVRPPGGWGRQPPSKPANEVSTGFSAATAGEPVPGRSPTTSACEPYREAIQIAVAQGRNAMAIWQDLVDTFGFTARYASVKRFIAKLRGPASPEACGIIETAAGEEAQVDYGTGPMDRELSAKVRDWG